MVDVNEWAIELTRENLKLYSFDNNVFVSDVYENVKCKYDYIITNPPIRAGKDIVRRFLLGSFDYLNDDGIFSIYIYNNNKNYKILTRNRNKNSLQKINSINHKISNIHIFNRKVFQLPSPQNKKNKSTENINDDCSNFNINGSNHNLTKEKTFRNTGNYLLGNSVKKKNKIYNMYNNALLNQLNSPSISYKDSIFFNSDINLNQKFDNKNINILKKIIENNYKSQNNKNRNFQDINIAKDNNINLKRIFNPINFKKSFNKKSVSKSKEIKLGQNLI
jgi:hypothetical protein